MKKGFTLVELIGTLVILAALVLVIVPLVDKQIKLGKEELYNDQINTIKLSMETWLNDNIKPDKGETITITLSQLKQAGLIDFDIQNTKTKTLFPNDMLLTITNTDGLLEYQVLTDTGSNYEDFKNMPIITITGNVLEYIDVDKTNGISYVDKGATAVNSSGEELNNVVTEIPSQIDVTKKGIYSVTYTAVGNGLTAKVMRTVIVRDKVSPTITYTNQNLRIKLSQVKDYDFKNDVTVTDNYDEDIELTVTHNIGLIVGTYTVEYQATDDDGNTAIVSRKVIVEAD